MRYQETTHNGRPFRIQRFESISDLLNHIRTTQPSQAFSSLYDQSSKMAPDSYNGYTTYDEAINMLTEGWAPEAEKLTKAITPSPTLKQSTRTKSIYSVVGHQASVPRYLQGIPTNMVHTQKTPVKNKVVTLYKDMAYSGGTSTKTIEEEGIKALRIIQLIESKGYRVKLVSFFLTSDGSDTIGFSTVIKRPEDRFSVLKMAFPLVHPAMLRRIGLAMVERHPTPEAKHYVSGYGRPSREYAPLTEGKGTVLPAFIPDINAFIDSLHL